MGLPLDWVTTKWHHLTANQQLTALGNGVLPLQAAEAIAFLVVPGRTYDSGVSS